MYSVVLMAALTAGSATPDCHRCGGCCGCWGGWGGCYGCWGGCYGGCYGGWGGCYGCLGGWGGCYGGCYGGWGGCYGCWGGYASWGYGGSAYPGTVAPVDGGMMTPGTTTTPGTEQLPPGKESKDKDKKGTMLSPNRAKLVVELPANAKLFIDDMPMKAAAGVRSFNTPELEPGQAYYYMVRVETSRDGKPVTETRRVIVRAGQVARADFTDLTSSAVRTVQAK